MSQVIAQTIARVRIGLISNPIQLDVVFSYLADKYGSDAVGAEYSRQYQLAPEWLKRKLDSLAGDI